VRTISAHAESTINLMTQSLYCMLQGDMSITELEVLDQCISDLLTSTQDIRTPRSSLLNTSLNQLVSIKKNLLVTLMIQCSGLLIFVFLVIELSCTLRLYNKYTCTVLIFIKMEQIIPLSFQCLEHRNFWSISIVTQESYIFGVKICPLEMFLLIRNFLPWREENIV
jgi:hypothetical protein